LNIEIIEFYLKEQNESKGFLNGTMRIKLPEIAIHILGINVVKKKDYWFFELPSRIGFDHLKEKATRYPCFSFEDKEKQRSLIEAIKMKGKEFIEAWTAKQGSHRSSKSAEKQDTQGNTLRACESSPRNNKTASIRKLPDVAKKEYVDLPPRQNRMRELKTSLKM